MKRRALVALALAGATLVSSTVAPAAPPVPAPPLPAPEIQRELEAARAAQAEAARNYRESLAALLPLQEAAVARAEAIVERRRALFAQGLIAAAELESVVRALDGARAAAEHTREAIGQAEMLVTEAEAAREVAALPPAPPGEIQEGPTLLRHEGLGRFSLAAVPALQRFFAERFGHALPISALGQTPAHDRLGFDHRNALDVAVHPDSAEGRTLLAHLRGQGIPFLAFRSKQAGVATGAHVHVGEPSARRHGLRPSARSGS